MFQKYRAIRKFPQQALPLRRCGRVRSEGFHLRVDEGAAGSRSDTQDVHIREEALAMLQTVRLDDDIPCRLRTFLSNCQLYSILNHHLCVGSCY